MKRKKKKRPKRSSDDIIIECSNRSDIWANKAKIYNVDKNIKIRKTKNLQEISAIAKYYNQKMDRILRHLYRLRNLQIKTQSR